MTGGQSSTGGFVAIAESHVSAAADTSCRESKIFHVVPDSAPLSYSATWRPNRIRFGPKKVREALMRGADESVAPRNRVRAGVSSM